MRPLPTNGTPIQYKTWVIGGKVYLRNQGAGAPLISFQNNLPGTYTLMRASAFFDSAANSNIAAGTNMLPYFRVSYTNSGLATQSLSLDSTGQNLVLVVRTVST